MRPTSYLVTFAPLLFVACAATAGETPTANGSSAVSTTDGGCLVSHLENAMQLNRTRRPLYADATWGLSLVISETLIGTETATLIPGAVLDAEAEPLDSIGVPMLCEDLMPMSNAPAFATHTAPVGSFVSSLGEADVAAVNAAIRARSFEGVAAAANTAVEAYAVAPTFHCMKRHLLESIRRAATQAPGQVARATGAGLEGAAETLAWNFINVQADGLGAAKLLDEVAAPFQADGVDIICRDVPPIPAN